GRNQNKFGIIPESPKFRLPPDSVFAHENMVGERTSFGYSLSVAPRRIAFVSNTISVGLSGSMGEQYSFDGCTEKAYSRVYAECGPRFDVSEPAANLRVQRTLDEGSWGVFVMNRIGLFESLYFTIAVRGETDKRYGSD